MLEEWIQRILKVLGAGDQVIAAGGPTATFVLAMLFGVAAAQALKQVFKNVVTDRWFAPLTQLTAIVSAIAFAHFLADSLNGGWEAAAGFSSIGFYHLSLKAIRKWAPWMEMNPLVGAVCPPTAARVADAQRQADKSGENSGA